MLLPNVYDESYADCAICSLTQTANLYGTISVADVYESQRWDNPLLPITDCTYEDCAYGWTAEELRGEISLVNVGKNQWQIKLPDPKKLE